MDGTGLGPAEPSVSPFRAGKTSAPDRAPTVASVVAVAGIVADAVAVAMAVGRDGEGEGPVIVDR
jgi:hypothetical protein